MNSLSKKQKKMVRRIVISAVLLVLVKVLCAVGVLPEQGLLTGLCYLVPYAVIGWDVLYKAVRNIKNGQVFDEILKEVIAVAKKVEPDCELYI